MAPESLRLLPHGTQVGYVRRRLRRELEADNQCPAVTGPNTPTHLASSSACTKQTHRSPQPGCCVGGGVGDGVEATKNSQIASAALRTQGIPCFLHLSVDDEEKTHRKRLSLTLTLPRMLFWLSGRLLGCWGCDPYFARRLRPFRLPEDGEALPPYQERASHLRRRKLAPLCAAASFRHFVCIVSDLVGHEIVSEGHLVRWGFLYITYEVHRKHASRDTMGLFRHDLQLNSSSYLRSHSVLATAPCVILYLSPRSWMARSRAVVVLRFCGLPCVSSWQF